MKGTKKGKKLVLEFKEKSLFSRFCNWLVRLIINRGWAGSSVLDGRFIETWATKPGRVHLISPERKKLIELAKKERKTVKRHFIGGPAYPLDLDIIRNDILAKFFGFEVTDLLTAHLVKGLPVDGHYRLDGPVFVKREKK